MLENVASLRDSHSEERSSDDCMIRPNRGWCLYTFGCELLSFAAYTGAVYPVSAAAAAVSAAAAAAASFTASLLPTPLCVALCAVCLKCGYLFRGLRLTSTHTRLVNRIDSSPIITPSPSNT